MMPKMQDMALTPEEKSEMAICGPSSPMSMINNYPYGLCISLGDEQLEKLNLDKDCEPGDFIHIFAMAKVTSVSKNDTGEGEKTRIELQITHMGIEDEGKENEEVETQEENKPPVAKRLRPKSLYK